MTTKARGEQASMARPKKPGKKEQQQPFDATFKAWIKEQARDILPLLLPGAIFLEALDVERIKPTMRYACIPCCQRCREPITD